MKRKNDKKNKRAISLITLIITIVIVIIFAGIIIFSIMNTNIDKKAEYAVFKSDVANFRDELKMYHNNKLLDENGEYVPKNLNGDKEKLEYGDKVIENESMLTTIKLMNQKPEYADKFIIFEGELVYVGDSKEEKDLAEEIGVDSKYDEPIIIIKSSTPNEVKSSIDVTYNIVVSSKFEITKLDYSKIYLMKETDNGYSLVQVLSKENIETVREEKGLIEIKVKIDTTNLENSNYYIKINKNFVIDLMDMTNSDEFFSERFTVNTIEYDNPNIIPSTTEYTNKSVEVEIEYPEGIIKKEYKIGENGEWQTYNGKVQISENKITVFARGEDELTNETKIAAHTVANIDTEEPTVSLEVTSKTTSSISVKVIASDTGVSGLNQSSYEYSSDNGETWTISSNTSYTYSGLKDNTTYNLKVRVSDNAGNTAENMTLVSDKTNSIASLGAIQLSPSTKSWTSRVGVTISYPTGIATKEYKIGSNGTWYTYTGTVYVYSNTTVYARGKDIAGNSTNESASLSISNIDSYSPSVTISSTSKTTSSVTVSVSSSDSQSGINSSSYQYSNGGSSWSNSTSSTSYTFSGLSAGTSYTLYVKVYDNVGNYSTNSVSVTTESGSGGFCSGSDSSTYTRCVCSCMNACTEGFRNCVGAIGKDDPRGSKRQACNDSLGDCERGCSNSCLWGN